MLASPEGDHRQRNQGEIAGLGVGLSLGLVLGRLLAGRRWRQLLDSVPPTFRAGRLTLSGQMQCLRFHSQ